MRCPKLSELPPALPDNTGWPWTEESSRLPEPALDGYHWPKVSIVIPSFNQGQFLEESIRSVLLQGYPDLECIIIDAGSTDESLEIIKKYEPWLAYWVSEPDRGQSHAINKGLLKSSGTWFNWHNADDMLTPNSVSTMAAAFLQHPEASSVYGYLIELTEETGASHHHQGILKGQEGFALPLEWFISNLKTYCQQGGLMDRELVMEIGMVDEDLHYVMDQDLVLRLALLKPLWYVDQPVVVYRIHAAAKTSATAEKALERLILARKLFQNRYLPDHLTTLKRPAFATAHSFAKNCYTDAVMYHIALWHLLLECLYMPSGKWGQRKKTALKLIKRMLVQLIKRLKSRISSFS